MTHPANTHEGERISSNPVTDPDGPPNDPLRKYEHPARVYRQVIGSSVAYLDSSVARFAGRKPTQTGLYAFNLVYPKKMGKARRQSPINRENQPTVGEITSKLGEITLPSLRQPVEAQVLGINPNLDGLSVNIAYPGMEEEQEEINGIVRSLLGIPERFRVQVGSESPHIDISEELRLRPGTLSRLEARLPPYVNLSAAIPLFAEMHSPQPV